MKHGFLEKGGKVGIGSFRKRGLERKEGVRIVGGKQARDCGKRKVN